MTYCRTHGVTRAVCGCLAYGDAPTGAELAAHADSLPPPTEAEQDAFDKAMGWPAYRTTDTSALQRAHNEGSRS